MKYHLALIPDRGDGQPDYDMNPLVLGPLPEGVQRLVVDASWHVDYPDRTFRGGVETIEYDDIEQ